MRVNRYSYNFFNALASETRLQIVEQLSEREMNLRELADALGLSVAIISRHIKQLESIGIVRCVNISSTHGLQKVCAINNRMVLLEFVNQLDGENVKTFQLPIGSYVEWAAQPTCGLSTVERIIGEVDDSRFFDDPAHVDAQMIWLTNGYLGYVVPNYMTGQQRVSRIRFQMELCSEAPYYNEQWPSDIYFYINGCNVGCWTSPGDFGARAGVYTPKWWMQGTQYGLLKTLTIDEKGSFIDGSPISDVTVADLNFAYGAPISFRIEAAQATGNAGGLCLFGKGFGNYDQGIVVSIEYASSDTTH